MIKPLAQHLKQGFIKTTYSMGEFVRYFCSEVVYIKGIKYTFKEVNGRSKVTISTFTDEPHPKIKEIKTSNHTRYLYTAEKVQLLELVEVHYICVRKNWETPLGESTLSPLRYYTQEKASAYTGTFKNNEEVRTILSDLQEQENSEAKNESFQGQGELADSIYRFIINLIKEYEGLVELSNRTYAFKREGYIDELGFSLPLRKNGDWRSKSLHFNFKENKNEVLELFIEQTKYPEYDDNDEEVNEIVVEKIWIHTLSDYDLDDLMESVEMKSLEFIAKNFDVSYVANTIYIK